MVRRMSRVRYLTVPINNIGIEEYNIGQETDNIITLELSEEEFYSLYHGGVFDRINSTCNLLIDDYESEIINKNHFNECKNIISNSNLVTNIFTKALDFAIEYDTLLGLDF
jgi:hypothetical protein